MKRKLIYGMLILAVTITSCSCGNNTVESQKTVSEAVSNETAPDQENVSDQESLGFEEVEPEKEEKDDSTTGTVQHGDGYTKTPIVTDKNLDIKGTSGPMEYTLEAIQISKLVATTNDGAELFDIEKDQEIALVVIDVSVENTSDDTVEFYIGNATLTSNTKEQVDPNAWFGDYIESEYLGNVIHSGTLMYFLKNSVAEDINNLKLHVSGPVDKDWNSLADDFVIELNLE